MSWTCPHCNEIVEEPSLGSIRFCLHCGQPSRPGHEGSVAVVHHGALRVSMIGIGLIWLLFFFLPFGQASFGTVMSWDLLANREGMSYLVSWPLMLSILYLVLGAVAPLPDWLRSAAAAVLGGAFLIVLGAGKPGGPLGADLRFVLMGGVAWVLLFPIMGAGLLLRARLPGSVASRILIGIGLLLGLVAFLSGAEGESTLVGALLRYLGEDRAVGAVSRVLILLPMFLCLASTVGFRMPGAEKDPARRWAMILAWMWLFYLPAFLVLYGLMTWVTEDSGYFFLMFLRMAFYLGGLSVMLVLAFGWLADHLPRKLLPLIRRHSFRKSANLD